MPTIPPEHLQRLYEDTVRGVLFGGGLRSEQPLMRVMTQTCTNTKDEPFTGFREMKDITDLVEEVEPLAIEDKR